VIYIFDEENTKYNLNMIIKNICIYNKEDIVKKILQIFSKERFEVDFIDNYGDYFMDMIYNNCLNIAKMIFDNFYVDLKSILEDNFRYGDIFLEDIIKIWKIVDIKHFPHYNPITFIEKGAIKLLKFYDKINPYTFEELEECKKIGGFIGEWSQKQINKSLIKKNIITPTEKKNVNYKK